jgi:hypothetical protein
MPPEISINNRYLSCFCRTQWGIRSAGNSCRGRFCRPPGRGREAGSPVKGPCQPMRTRSARMNCGTHENNLNQRVTKTAIVHYRTGYRTLSPKAFLGPRRALVSRILGTGYRARDLSHCGCGLDSWLWRLGKTANIRRSWRDSIFTIAPGASQCMVSFTDSFPEGRALVGAVTTDPHEAVAAEACPRLGPHIAVPDYGCDQPACGHVQMLTDRKGICRTSRWSRIAMLTYLFAPPCYAPS